MSSFIDSITIRDFDSTADAKAANRIWQETGWIERDNSAHITAMDDFLRPTRSLVAELNGEAECLVSCGDARLRYLDSELPLSAVLAVTTSLIARKRDLASRLVAQSVAREAEAGMPLSALGMFEQGYYDRLGFGTGPYEIEACFNPAHLLVNVPLPQPVRLDNSDYADMHNALVKRKRSHGGVIVESENFTKAETAFTELPTGLGFRNKKGELTHFIWGSNKGENGPFEITMLAYQNTHQLQELLALIRSLGDQVFSVKLNEPPEIQLQDFLKQPFMRQETTSNGDYAESFTASAYWQLRINDLEACLRQTCLPTNRPLTFNLALTDPISEFLPSGQSWRGIGGDYTVTLGSESRADKGKQAGLPHLHASVNGFSRLWLGCASAQAIALHGEINAEQTLLEDLETCLRLPTPRTGMDF